MKKKIGLKQQGDVLFFSQDKLPDGLKKVNPKDRGFVLAEGETTGHAHVIDEIDLCDVYEDEAKTLWLVTKAEATVKHEEHKAITLPKGVFKIGIVREVDPFTEAIEKVRD